MILGKRILALIPARAGSKGLPGKNIRPLLGKPLICWSIEQALLCRYIDSVVVSTDARQIAEIASACGAQVPFLRPAELASDTASSVDVLLHAVQELSNQGEHYEIVVLLEPTSPLRLSSDVESAIERLVQHSTARSIVGMAVAESSHPAFLYRLGSGGLMTPFAPESPPALRRQDLEPLYYLEGSFYISWLETLLSARSFYHDKMLGYMVPRHLAYEIDELADFVVVEALMRARDGGLL